MNDITLMLIGVVIGYLLGNDKLRNGILALFDKKKPEAPKTT